MYYFIYLISTEENKCKIGVSKNPKERLKSLQTANPGKLILEETYKSKLPYKYAVRLEKRVHNHYKQYETNGEWFQFLHNVKNNFIFVCEENEKIIECLMDNPFWI